MLPFIVKHVKSSRGPRFASWFPSVRDHTFEHFGQTGGTMILATVIALSTLILAVRSGAVIALRWHFLNSRAEPATNNAAAVNASRLCADRLRVA